MDESTSGDTAAPGKQPLGPTPGHAELERMKRVYADAVAPRLAAWREQFHSQREDASTTRSYKASNGLLAVFVGTIAAFSFVIGGVLEHPEEASMLTRLLSVGVALPILSIVLEMGYGARAAALHAQQAQARLDFLGTLGKRQLDTLLRPYATPDDVGRAVEGLLAFERDGFVRIREEYDGRLRQTESLRRWSFGAFVLALVLIALVLLLRLRFFGTLGEALAGISVLVETPG